MNALLELSHVGGRETYLVTMEWNVKQLKPLAFVGKVCFDTGGY